MSIFINNDLRCGVVQAIVNPESWAIILEASENLTPSDVKALEIDLAESTSSGKDIEKRAGAIRARGDLLQGQFKIAEANEDTNLIESLSSQMTIVNSEARAIKREMDEYNIKKQVVMTSIDEISELSSASSLELQKLTAALTKICTKYAETAVSGKKSLFSADSAILSMSGPVTSGSICYGMINAATEAQTESPVLTALGNPIVTVAGNVKVFGERSVKVDCDIITSGSMVITALDILLQNLLRGVFLGAKRTNDVSRTMFDLRKGIGDLAKRLLMEAKELVGPALIINTSVDGVELLVAGDVRALSCKMENPATFNGGWTTHGSKCDERTTKLINSSVDVTELAKSLIHDPAILQDIGFWNTMLSMNDYRVRLSGILLGDMPGVNLNERMRSEDDNLPADIADVYGVGDADALLFDRLLDAMLSSMEFAGPVSKPRKTVDDKGDVVMEHASVSTSLAFPTLLMGEGVFADEVDWPSVGINTIVSDVVLNKAKHAAQDVFNFYLNISSGAISSLNVRKCVAEAVYGLNIATHKEALFI